MKRVFNLFRIFYRIDTKIKDNTIIDQKTIEPNNCL